MTESTKEKFIKVKKPKFLTNQELIEAYKSLLPFINKMLEVKDTRDIISAITQSEKKFAIVPSPVPENGLDSNSLITFMKENIFSNFYYENSFFLGFIPRSPTNISILADSLVPFFNQYSGSAQASPLASGIEAQSIKWIGDLLGFSGDFFGNFTVGASHANLECLYVGLTSILSWDVQKYGVIHNQRPMIYLTDQVHMCIPKAIKILGLGNASLRYVKTNNKLEMDINDLKQKIDEDKLNQEKVPAIIVITAGTTNTGTIDPIEEISLIAKNNNLWLHIDAAYGGFAKLADHPISQKLQNLHLADSLAIDTHKWFYTPLEGGVTIIKDESFLKKTFATTAEYYEDAQIEEEPLFRNFSDYGIALSRRWRGLMVWCNFKFYGKSGISNLITRNILLADYFREQINNLSEFEIFDYSQLGIVCFSHIGGKKINDKIYQSFMSGKSKYFIGRTELKGKSVLRISILHEHTRIEQIDEILADLILISQDL